jgi:hypothetical protein
VRAHPKVFTVGARYSPSALGSRRRYSSPRPNGVIPFRGGLINYCTSLSMPSRRVQPPDSLQRL